MSINIYLGLAVNGFFTGLGVVMANAFYDRVIKKHYERIKKLRKRLT